MRLVTYVLVWLALTSEIEGEIFSGKWETPLTWLGTLIFKPLPVIKAPIWDIAVLIALAAAAGSPGASKNRTKPMVTSMRVALLSIGALWMWGVVRGGDIRQTMWQLHSFVIAVVLAFLVSATCRTSAQLTTLGKVVAFAAVYRAFVLIVFYFTIARGLNPPLQTLTTHADSALFVTGMLLFIVNAMERRTLVSFMWMIAGCIPLALAIKWNNRRLAWLSLIVGMAVAYAMLPKSRFKKRVNMLLLASLPLIAMYVTVGWGKNDGIFKPVGAISTMFGTHADTSSEMRDIENYNLVQTLRDNPSSALAGVTSTRRSPSPSASATCSRNTASSRTTACLGCSRSAVSSGSRAPGSSSSWPASSMRYRRARPSHPAYAQRASWASRP